MIHLAHLPIDPRAFAAWSGHRDLARRDDGLTLHVLFAAVFGKGALQPFRLFDPAQGGWSLYAYTDRDASALAEMAALVAPPECLPVVRPEMLRTKPVPDLRNGLRLGFDLRTRPVKRRTREGQHGGTAERDAYQVIAEASDGAVPDRAAVYAGWLSERLGSAATLETCRLTAFRRLRVLRNNRAVEGPDATLQGTLTITDAEQFSSLLARGVGRHRAYGYGMLLLRPPDRSAGI